MIYILCWYVVKSHGLPVGFMRLCRRTHTHTHTHTHTPPNHLHLRTPSPPLRQVTEKRSGHQAASSASSSSDRSRGISGGGRGRISGS
eukprot:365284-Pyramimonas_sp.AAC.1